MRTASLLLTSAALLLAASFSCAGPLPSTSKHAAKNIPCAACHVKEPFRPVPKEQCATCHNPEELARRTEKLNFTSTMKNPKTGDISEHKALINPHDSYHFGKTEDCTDCHREHRASLNDCATCHDTKAWGVKDPK